MEKGIEKGMEKGMEKGIAIGEAKANQKVQESKRQAIIKLMKTTRLENFQIAEAFDVPITFVEAIRLELSSTKP
jgi:flagellar biosynthesis/type III secretory pathway protein FliH